MKTYVSLHSYVMTFAANNAVSKILSSEAHHIKLTSEGGKDTINNLMQRQKFSRAKTFASATLGSKCHSKVHSGKIQLKAKGVSGFKDKIAQRTMPGKHYLYSSLNQKYGLERVYGYQTAAERP